MESLVGRMPLSRHTGAAMADDTVGTDRWRQFRFAAVVDWVELDFELASRTHFRHVRKELAVPYAQALKCGPGACSTLFRVKFHDVRCHQTLVEAVRQLQTRWGLVEQPRISALELAADLSLRQHQGAADLPRLAEIGAEWYRAMDIVIRDNHRLYRDRRSGVNFNIPREVPLLATQLLDGWQLGMGSRDAPVLQHLYVKTTDQNGTPIPTDQYRIRLELRITGEAGWAHFGMPMPTLDQIADLPVSRRMAKHFYRRVFDDGPAVRRLRPFLRVIQQPARRWDQTRLRGGGTSAYPPGSKADSHFNKRMHAAFRQLRGTWRSTGK